MATEIHTMRTQRNLTTMEVMDGTFEKAEDRRNVFFRSKKHSPRPNINSNPVESIALNKKIIKLPSIPRLNSLNLKLEVSNNLRYSPEQNSPLSRFVSGGQIKAI